MNTELDYMRHLPMQGPKRLEHYIGNEEWLTVPKANRVGITDDFLRRMALLCADKSLPAAA